MPIVVIFMAGWLPVFGGALMQRPPYGGANGITLDDPDVPEDDSPAERNAEAPARHGRSEIYGYRSPEQDRSRRSNAWRGPSSARDGG